MIYYSCSFSAITIKYSSFCAFLLTQIKNESINLEHIVVYKNGLEIFNLGHQGQDQIHHKMFLHLPGYKLSSHISALTHFNG